MHDFGDTFIVASKSILPQNIDCECVFTICLQQKYKKKTNEKFQFLQLN